MYFLGCMISILFVEYGMKEIVVAKGGKSKENVYDSILNSIVWSQLNVRFVIKVDFGFSIYVF